MNKDSLAQIFQSLTIHMYLKLIVFVLILYVFDWIITEVCRTSSKKLRTLGIEMLGLIFIIYIMLY
ncbi:MULTISPECIES: hypothetical protein [Heyndrickxia]|jgi:hypothetical protein|uniref:Uncharacterized protein n=1 Tax=Heyndrickxia oleronia TaxID=38875 RepID=A0A8E2I457_9BACI|nr:hypothetical protein [Heyndrickxia oleronia]NYV63853.1 hypothetical protein [Bacillus sp. Gen3]MBU5212679.1 hypothetical protein [Heyndrickxia oleronia]MCI1591427.1 hypothetical protein [Heyndrickxia oleronia]MCI1613845.1 hypothetical protein [Heyndrickxia oleronia]MCI1744975.1 hypothetical protein [Heyndrickxia oleronia]